MISITETLNFAALDSQMRDYEIRDYIILADKDYLMQQERGGYVRLTAPEPHLIWRATSKDFNHIKIYGSSLEPKYVDPGYETEVYLEVVNTSKDVPAPYVDIVHRMKRIYGTNMMFVRRRYTTVIQEEELERAVSENALKLLEGALRYRASFLQRT